MIHFTNLLFKTNKDLCTTYIKFTISLFIYVTKTTG